MRNEKGNEGNESVSHNQSEGVCQDCTVSTQASSGNEGAQTTHTY
jgi:hypothetical protein